MDKYSEKKKKSENTSEELNLEAKEKEDINLMGFI